MDHLTVRAYVVQLPKTSSGKHYVAVSVDYLTKWPEVFATSNKSADITKLLVDKILSRDNVSSQLSSDCEGAFLLNRLQESEMLLGFHRVITTGYHPQTDGLAEKFNRTLIYGANNLQL